MAKTQRILGTVTFNSNKIDVTDPCYDQDVWCRASLDIEPGEYEYQAIIRNCGDWGNRVASLKLFKPNASGVVARTLKVAATIGVDAGLAGFFENKPDYTDEQWSAICDFLFTEEKRGPTVEKACLDNPFACEGICVASGYGDGEYNVYVLVDGNNNPCGYEIKFI